MHGDGSFTRRLAQLVKIAVLILDDWGLQDLDQAARNEIYRLRSGPFIDRIDFFCYAEFHVAEKTTCSLAPTAAAMYSLIGTCKLNEIKPRAYLEYVRTHIADHKVNRIDELLPWNVADKLKSAAPPMPKV